LSLDLTASPSVFPLILDAPGDRVALVRLDEAAYQAASFLDERIIAAGAEANWTSWPRVEQVGGRLPIDLDFIFHVSHVGSTLVSRLLGQSERIFSLREPAILRALAAVEGTLDTADSPWARPRLETAVTASLGLLSRVFRPRQRSLVKATSFVGEMAVDLMTIAPSSRAIAMFVAPQVFLAGILAGPAARGELLRTAPERLSRLHRRLGGAFRRIQSLSDGEVAAMTWTCELLGLAAAAQRFESRVLWVDFEAFLRRPGEGLAAMLAHLHGEADVDEVAAMLASRDFGRYSKAPEHPYDARLRQRVLSQAMTDHRVEIERGLAWLNAAGGRHAPIAEAAKLAAASRAS
jgi:hypothetical protein